MSGRIPQAFIHEVLARTDIVELIQARIELKKRGNNYQACCPFHTEKTPSFSVNADKQFYYCFGCNASGNAISFLMEFDRIDFLDALKDLASQAGLELPENTEDSAVSAQQKTLFPLMERVSQYYQQQLRQSTEAIDYLKSRGLNGHTAKRFQLGFAPEGWNNLTRHLGTSTELTEQLLACGMLIRKDQGGTYDRFRNRVLFPIRDVRGRVIAFGGRTMGDDTPKYLNSPETTLFHKSYELYGLYEARQQNRNLARLLIVEGYMDVVSLNQAGITYSVATLGTATNAKHLQKLLRYTNEVVFCFDGDNAGKQAAWKALLISLPLMRDGIELKFMFLPAGEDPDTLVQKLGAPAFEAQISEADSLSDVFFSQLEAQIPLNSLADKARFAKTASTHLNTMPKGLFRELLYDQLASLLGIKKNELETAFIPTEAPQKQTPKPKPLSRRNTTIPAPAELAISLLLKQPSLSAEVTDCSFLESLDLPGAHLLKKLLLITQENSAITTGQLLLHAEDPNEQAQIAALTSRTLPIPDEGMSAEFIGAIERLQEQHIARITDQLIEKSKKNELTPAEKEKLRALLIPPKNDPK